jgi:AcrR family transcriptional regulator
MSLALFGIPACSAAPSSPAEKVSRTQEPIIDGTDSPSSQNFVVLIAHPVNGLNEVFECSGTLVAPDLVLTARHCVSSTPDQGFTCDSSGNGSSGGAIGTDFDPSSLWIFVGAGEPSTITRSNASAVGARLFHDDATNLCDHDVALIALDRSIPSTQAEVATLAFDPKPAAGDVFTAVGWGVTSNNQTPAVRQERTNIAISHVGPYTNSQGEEVPPSEFDVGESICEGDSGSPALDGTNAVIGVASRGGNNLTPTASTLAASCEGDQTLNYYSQIGAFSEVILQAFQSMGETPTLPSDEAVGSFCETSSDCASGPCIGTGTGMYCSKTCATDSACPAGYSCNSVSGQSLCEQNSPSSGGCNLGARASAPSGGAGLFAAAGLLAALVRRRRPAALEELAPRPRTKPKEVRREELMDAAERIFLRKGVAATSVDEIVAAADVAKGTFYIHFESKERLLVALRQRFVTRFSGDLLAAMNRRRADDWKGRLRAWLEVGVDVYLDRNALHDVVFHEFRADDPRTKHDNPIIDQLAGLLTEGTRAGAWSVEVPHLTAVLLFHALHGALDDAIDGTKNVNRKRLTRALEVFFCRAVGIR